MKGNKKKWPEKKDVNKQEIMIEKWKKCKENRIEKKKERQEWQRIKRKKVRMKEKKRNL